MSDLDRKFANRISAKIAKVRMLAILKKDKGALATLDQLEARYNAWLTEMNSAKVIPFREISSKDHSF